MGSALLIAARTFLGPLLPKHPQEQGGLHAHPPPSSLPLAPELLPSGSSSGAICPSGRWPPGAALTRWPGNLARRSDLEGGRSSLALVWLLIIRGTLTMGAHGPEAGREGLGPSTRPAPSAQVGPMEEN